MTALQHASVNLLWGLWLGKHGHSDPRSRGPHWVRHIRKRDGNPGFGSTEHANRGLPSRRWTLADFVRRALAIQHGQQLAERGVPAMVSGNMAPLTHTGYRTL